MNEVITLKNGLRFVVLSKLDFEGEKYLYLSSYDNCDDLQIIFAKVHDSKKIEPIEDGMLIVKLMEVVNKEVERNKEN